MGRLVLALSALVLLTGCASLDMRGNWDPFAGAEERRLVVRVQNVNINEVTIHAVSPGRQLELGRVGGRAVRHFSIPWAGMQDIRFQIDIVAGRRHTTPGVSVAPGDQVELIVHDPVQRSFVRR